MKKSYLSGKLNEYNIIEENNFGTKEIPKPNVSICVWAAVTF